MREELVRRNYAQTTIRTYLMAMEEFRRRAQKRLDHIGPDDIRHYQVALLEEKKLAIGTIALRVSALRFFYLKVLKKRALKDELPYPKNPKWARRLPTILTPEEMSRLIDSAKNLFHYAMLLTMYSCGLRRSELCRLKVSVSAGIKQQHSRRFCSQLQQAWEEDRSCQLRTSNSGFGIFSC
jgi:site-specific recombinase XerD